jgi:putative hydrolase of the HAD superfamily
MTCHIIQLVQVHQMARQPHHSVPISLALFDLGDVVCHFRPARRLAALAAASALPAQEIQARLWESGFSQACDSGQYSTQAMYERACALLAWHPSYATFCAVWALAFEPNKALLRLVDRVRRQVRTGLLTNNPPLLQDSLPELLPEIHRRFDPLLFSYQFGALKPSAALFTAVLVQLGLPFKISCSLMMSRRMSRAPEPWGCRRVS